ncbi:MAG: helix-turn-helix domain-containing protein [Bacteroidia bacterium]|nr:helix-turn-helix domain-containing protein [Bacteroidia bacterium]
MKEDYLNTKEAGLFIGKKSAGAVRNLVMRRAIPYRKVGGRLFFLRSELELWISDAPGLRLEEIQDERR